MRDIFIKTRNLDTSANSELASRIKRFWFNKLPAGAIDGVAGMLSAEGASNLLGSINLMTTKKTKPSQGQIGASNQVMSERSANDSQN